MKKPQLYLAFLLLFTASCTHTASRSHSTSRATSYGTPRTAPERQPVRVRRLLPTSGRTESASRFGSRLAQRRAARQAPAPAPRPTPVASRSVYSSSRQTSSASTSTWRPLTPRPPASSPSRSSSATTSRFTEVIPGRYAFIRRPGRVEVYSYRNGSWVENKSVSSSMTRIQSMKVDPATGKVVFLGKMRGSNRMAVMSSNSSGSQTDSFLLPAGLGPVHDIASINGKVYVASGRGKNGTLTVFGSDGQLESTAVTGELSTLEVAYRGGKPVLQATGSDGVTTEFSTTRPIDQQVSSGES